jgi:hypothetical protein
LISSQPCIPQEDLDAHPTLVYLKHFGLEENEVMLVSLLVFTGSSLARLNNNLRNRRNNFVGLFSQVHPWHVTMLGRAKA